MAVLMQKNKAKEATSTLANEGLGLASEDILWLKDFLFYRIPAAAAYMLRETSIVCAAQSPALTTAQWRIISILANHPSLLAKEISRISMLDEVAVSRALALLTRRGFVQKKRNRQDKRAREVTLAAAGWRYYAAIMPRMKEQNEIICSLFNSAELSALYAAFDRMDELFESLGAQRRLYGTGLNLKDLVERKVSTLAKPSKPDGRRKK